MKKRINHINEKFYKILQGLLPENQINNFLNTRHKPLKKSITINTSKISIKDFSNITKKRGWKLTPILFTKNTHTFYIDRKNLDIPLGKTFLHQAGFFYIQEVAASLPATQIYSKSSDIILDMAASPGGKSSQLAKRILDMHNTNKNNNSKKESLGIVVSNDIESKRIGTLIHNLRQGGYFNTLITKFNGQVFGEHLPDFFDHVLLDAPCSGEGTGFKSDLAMQFRNQSEINKICGLQYQLLKSAIETVKIGGTIVYSTCTLNPFENEGILAKILLEFKENIKLESIKFQGLNIGVSRKEKKWKFNDTKKVARCWPHIQKTGGFFIAKIKKLSNSQKRNIKKHHKLIPKRQQGLKYNIGIQKEIEKRLQKNRGISIDKNKYFFLASKEQIYLTSPGIKKVIQQIYYNKLGIPILKIERKGYRPTHYLGNILGHLATKNIICLNDEQAQKYSEGKNISLININLSKCEKSQKHLIVTRKGYGFSITKIINNELKNKRKK